MEGKIAVLGDADFVMPFSALGADTYACAPEAEQIAGIAETIINQRYALVVIAENIAPLAESFFAAQRTQPLPSIVVVPFTQESEGFATQALGSALKIATGIDIFKE